MRSPSYPQRGPGHHAGILRKGICKKLVSCKDGEVLGLCGQPFEGPPNRKYCSEHSKGNKYRGKEG